MLKNVKIFGKKYVVGLMAMISCSFLFTAVAFASYESYTTYYSMTNATWSKTHDASATPTATIKTSNMTGNSNDKLFVEIDKQYWYGWAAPGSSNSSATVSSVTGSTFSVAGNGSGTYRLGFMKNSYAQTGTINSDNKTWYADLNITYSK